MSVALGYGSVFPALALPLLRWPCWWDSPGSGSALHFPGDVLAGQAIASATAALLLAAS